MIIGMMLVHNEQDRWLEKTLEQMKAVCNRICVLDDGSTDRTPHICREYGAEVYSAPDNLWPTNELLRRIQLWKMATVRAKPGDWLLCLDADETIAGVTRDRFMAAVRSAELYGCDSLAFRLFDMWDDKHYRDDEYWTAHKRLWVMAVKYFQNREYEFRDMPLHCGRFPMNASISVGIANMDIQHWGYSRPEERQQKFERYMLIDPKGENGDLGQYMSIIEYNPNLKEYVYEQVF